MKKFFLTLMFTLLVTNICFAEDLYILSDEGFAKYFRSDSIVAKVTAKNERESLFEMTYTLVCIPDNTTLNQLRFQAMDNKIVYKKQTFTFTCSFNPSNNQWLPNGSLWINNDEIWGGSPEKCLYELHGLMPTGPYYGDTPPAVSNRNTVIAVYDYVISHNLIKY